MKKYATTRQVPYGPDEMFALVADIERYPLFVPLCESLTVRRRSPGPKGETIIADMTVAYRFLRESFITRVDLVPDERRILVNYVDGPFRHLENEWRFVPLAEQASEIVFKLEYEFRSIPLEMLMGAMFDRAFRKFVTAFEARAALIHGPGMTAGLSSAGRGNGEAVSS